MYGYSGLHYLRRIAAHLDLSGKLPSPGDKDASNDAFLQKYYQLVEGKPSRFFNRLRLLQRPSTQKKAFDHLVFHSDAEGYYLPQDFPAVLFPPASIEIPGGMIGSSIQLLDECSRLAKTLELPLDLNPEAEDVWNACESQGTGATQWQRYGIESFTCLRLHAAAQHSMKTGAAIVFC